MDRHDIAEKLLSWHKTTITHSLTQNRFDCMSNLIFFRDQFKHQRMHNSNMEINNPIFIARQPASDIEHESEIEPLDIEDHVRETTSVNYIYHTTALIFRPVKL